MDDTKDELKMVRDLKKMNKLVERLFTLVRKHLGGNPNEQQAN